MRAPFPSEFLLIEDVLVYSICLYCCGRSGGVCADCSGDLFPPKEVLEETKEVVEEE